MQYPTQRFLRNMNLRQNGRADQQHFADEEAPDLFAERQLRTDPQEDRVVIPDAVFRKVARSFRSERRPQHGAGSKAALPPTGGQNRTDQPMKALRVVEHEVERHEGVSYRARLLASASLIA